MFLWPIGVKTSDWEWKFLGIENLGVIKGANRISCWFTPFFAERGGFEPPVPLGTAVFKTAVIDHSTISPDGISKRKAKNEVFARRFCDHLSAKVIHTCEICKLLRTFCGFFVLKRIEEREFGVREMERERGWMGMLECLRIRFVEDGRNASLHQLHRTDRLFHFAVVAT